LTREPQLGDLETLGRCSRRWWVMCTRWGGGDFSKVKAVSNPVHLFRWPCRSIFLYSLTQSLV